MAKNEAHTEAAAKRDAVRNRMTGPMDELLAALAKKEEHELLGAQIAAELDAAVKKAQDVGWPVNTLVELGAPRPPRKPRKPKTEPTTDANDHTGDAASGDYQHDH